VKDLVKKDCNAQIQTTAPRIQLGRGMVGSGGSGDGRELAELPAKPNPHKVASALSGAVNFSSNPQRSRCHRHECKSAKFRICTTCRRAMAGAVISNRQWQSYQPLSVPPPTSASLPHLAQPAGAMAGAVVSACVQPLDVLRTRMQADAAAGRLQGSVSTLRMLLREAGTR